jgi:DNA-binding XRE family transcriptional regulator
VLIELGAVRAEGLWEAPHDAGRSPAGTTALLVADVPEDADPLQLKSWVGLPWCAFVLLVVGTESAMARVRRPDIAVKISESPMLLLDMTSAGEPGAGEARVVRDYLRVLLPLLEPDRVLAARFAVTDRLLWIQFGDGLERAVRWSDLPFSRKLGIVPVGVSTRLGGESITVADQAGNQIDVSASSLRAFFDEEFRSRLESGDAAERRVVGSRIRALRENAKLSQEELSRRTGIAQESLSRIETGRRDPRLGTLQRLARGLGLTLDELMERLSVGDHDQDQGARRLRSGPVQSGR